MSPTCHSTSGSGDETVSPMRRFAVSNAGASIAGSITERARPAQHGVHGRGVFESNRLNWFAGSRHLKQASSALNVFVRRQRPASSRILRCRGGYRRPRRLAGAEHA